MKLAPPILAWSLVLACSAMSASAPRDTLETYWGAVPPPDQARHVVPEPVPLPLWKHLVRIPYYVGAVPVNTIDWTLRYSLTRAERLGLFEPVEAVVEGVRDPLGNYWLPTGSIGEDRGIELGFVVQRPHLPATDWVTKLSYTTSTKRSRHLAVGARSHVGGSEWVELGAGVLREARIEYYGRGPDTDQDDESVYRRALDWAGASWRHEWGDRLEATAAAHYSTVTADRSRYEVDEALADVFAGRVPFGYGRASSGVTGSLKLGYDDTRIDGNPERGTRVVVRAERFWNTDDTEVALWTWGVSAERYFRLWLPNRTLAVKAWWLQQERLGGDPIPFTRLLDNDDPYRLRGFDSQRFHATGITGVTLEYRWPFWIYNRPGGAGLDAYVFGDAGQPFDRAADVGFAHLRYSGGFGLRAIGTARDFAVRAELAVSDEGVRVRLSAKQMFDFIQAGFYDGHEPLPILR